MKTLFLRSLCLCLLCVLNPALAKDIAITLPQYPMDYNAFGATLSGGVEDIPRIRGIIAQNLAQCYVEAAKSANGIASAKARLEENCEFMAQNEANIPLLHHYLKANAHFSLNLTDIESQKQIFWQESKGVILKHARAIRDKTLGF